MLETLQLLALALVVGGLSGLGHLGANLRISRGTGA